MKFMIAMLAAVPALAGCAGTPLVNSLMGPGDTLIVRSAAPLFDDRVGIPGYRRGQVKGQVVAGEALRPKVTGPSQASR